MSSQIGGWQTSFSLGDPTTVHNLAEQMAPTTPADLAGVVAQNIDAIGPHTGISAEHLHKLHDIAKEHKCIIAFRPVDPHNAQLIAEGLPTKGLEVKGKSSNVGPLYGFIPANQALARTTGKTPEQIAALQAQTDTCLAKGDATKINLELSKPRFNYLIDEKLIVKSGGARDHFEVSVPGHAHVKFTLKRTDQDTYQVLHDGKPVEVLAPPADGKAPAKPYTADYDLFFLMPSWDQVSAVTQRRSSARPADPLEPRAVLRRMTGDSADQASAARSATPDNHVTALETRIIDDINTRLRGDLLAQYQAKGPSPWNLVHHGSDEGNPNTSMDSNLPTTVVSPVALGSQGAVLLANDKGELGRVLDEARSSGYVLTGHREWFDAELQTSTRRKASLFERRDSAYASSPVSADSRRGSLLPEQDRAMLAALGDSRRSSLANVLEQPSRGAKKS